MLQSDMRHPEHFLGTLFVALPARTIHGITAHDIAASSRRPLCHEQFELPQPLDIICNHCLPHIQRGQPLRICNQSILRSLPRQPQVGIVRSQTDPVLRPRRKHPIRLQSPLSDQIIDQNSDVGFIPPQNKRFRCLLSPVRRTGRSSSIGSGDDPLGSGFFVSGRSAYLSCEVESGDGFGFEGVSENPGIDEVVFDVVAGADDFDVFEAFHCTENLELDFFRVGS
mmetsp:Transcript_4784/g.10545  ORF Transcript_4784/g.10545 Transcript_4784/m.10545 type:complete len:225 (-) Transcript_4784:863-1537(-)